MWTSSVTAFTAIIFVVHFNLFTRMKYITIHHAISIFACSMLPYMIYMWMSNYLPANFSQTKNAVLEAHYASNFYLKIACTIGATFMLDYAFECYMVLIVQDPTEYLRLLVSQGKTTEDPANMEHFKSLVEREDLKNR